MVRGKLGSEEIQSSTHLRLFLGSGGSRAASIASSNTFFNPFCGNKTFILKIEVLFISYENMVRELDQSNPNIPLFKWHNTKTPLMIVLSTVLRQDLVDIFAVEKISGHRKKKKLQ